MKFYVVKGTNGVIIIQGIYAKAVKCQNYIKKSTIKMFDSFEDAGVILLCLMLIDFASMLAVCYSALKASFIAEYHPTIYRL